MAQHASLLYSGIWSDFIDLVVEDQLLQLTQVNSKTISDAIKLSTEPNSAICYLTEDLKCDFANFDKDTLRMPKEHYRVYRKHF